MNSHEIRTRKCYHLKIQKTTSLLNVFIAMASILCFCCNSFVAMVFTSRSAIFTNKQKTIPENIVMTSRTSKSMKLRHCLYEFFYNGYQAIQHVPINIFKMTWQSQYFITQITCYVFPKLLV